MAVYEGGKGEAAEAVAGVSVAWALWGGWLRFIIEVLL